MKLKVFILIASMFSLALLNAQSYNISNATVYDCYANFTDSDAGSAIVPSYYGHNEDFVFSICPSGADSIILSFSSFCSELNLDVITFHDGPNTSAPVIGIPYSGIVNIPPIIATSGCLTVHFTSDGSVACEGWVASWQSVINIPPNPTFSPIPNPLCNTNSLILDLDQDLLCAGVNPSDFTIFGPSNQTVTSVTPLNCTNGTTNSIQVDFSPGLSSNGSYTVQFSSDFLDACDSLWQLTAFGTFNVSDCPISLEIVSPDTQICTGTCTSLEAIAWGGDGNYSFVWNNGLPANAGPHNVCPLNTTTYTCTVTDGSGAPAGFAQIQVEVIPQSVLPPDFTICQSDPNVDLDATPNTGYWNGPCFGNDTLAGIFHPGWCGTGVKTIYYNNGGCIDSMNITINPMSVGATRQLVCPGSAPFNIWTNNPGGTFTGTGITDAALGTFDPVLAGIGVHNITYSNPPCADRTKIITVGTATIQADDTLCLNSDRYQPTFSPQGGTWTGTGVTNWYWCRFDPAIAGPGSHDLIYTYGACSDTLTMTVIDIDAGNDRLVCPAEAPFNLTGSPLGGTWSGQGIVDPILGTFDPGANGGNNFNPYVTYTFNGCSDSIRIYVRNTVIPVDPLPSFCTYDSSYTLNYDSTGRTPWGGTWSGIGISNPSSNGSFTPSLAGQGTFTLYYTANTCTDSTTITVYPDPLLQDTTVCIVQSAFNIPTTVNGGLWAGIGVVNPNSGTFLPSLAGIGSHLISYTTPNNCTYEMTITVDTLPSVSLNGLPEIWCFADTNFIITQNPLGGIWGGASNDSIFNPIEVGSGVFTINYTIGSGECAVSTSSSIQIRDTLKVDAFFTDTSICKGEYVRIGAVPSGGDFLNYSFEWANGLGGSPEIVLQGDTSGTYAIQLEDGCSEPARDSLNVNIFPDYTVGVDSSLKVCFGLQGWLKLTPMPSGQYSYIWENDSTLTADSLSGIAGRYYDVTVVNDLTNCSKTYSLQIPSYSDIVADFIAVPNECVNLLDPEFYFIDQSIGGESGVWNFGDGTSIPYSLATNIYQLYEDTGVYEVVLQIQNEGGCIDDQSLTVCVKPSTLVIAPTAFSPNGDGVNDEFIMRTIGALNPELSIYNRWGEHLFSTQDLSIHWNGEFKGKIQEIGSYTWQLKYHSMENNKEELQKGIFQLIK